jgi:hypothetical protein
MVEPLAAVDEPAPAANEDTQAAHASNGLFDEVSLDFLFSFTHDDLRVIASLTVAILSVALMAER